MLAELSVVEQRYLAVREALDTGAKVTDVAIRLRGQPEDPPPLARPLRHGGPGRARGSQLQARSLPPPDRSGDRSPDRVAQNGPSRLGSAHHPQQAPA
jgi:hypothetical protein